VSCGKLGTSQDFLLCVTFLASGSGASLGSETCRARLTPRPFVPKQDGRNRRATWPRPKVAGASFLQDSKRETGLPIGTKDLSGLAMTVRIIPMLAVAIMIGPSLAYGSPACMTQSEARAKFPNAHLYMHGSEHCWNDSAANGFRALPAAPVQSLRRPARAALSAPSPGPALAAAPVPSRRPETVDSGNDAGAQCQYSPCE
jgi:hypothetical protein